MLTGMQGVTPNVKRAMQRIEGAGRRVHRHALDAAPIAVENKRSNFVFCSGAAMPVAIEKTDRRYAVSGPRPVGRQAAEAVFLANPTMSDKEVAKRAKCSLATAGEARRRLVDAKRIEKPMHAKTAPHWNALIAAIQADGTLSAKEYAKRCGLTVRGVHKYFVKLREAKRLVTTLSIVDVDHA